MISLENLVLTFFQYSIFGQPLYSAKRNIKLQKLLSFSKYCVPKHMALDRTKQFRHVPVNFKQENLESYTKMSELNIGITCIYRK